MNHARAIFKTGSARHQRVYRSDGRDNDFPLHGEAAPTVVTAISMLFTFFIAHGIAFGSITYAAIKILAGRIRDLSPMVAVIAVMFVPGFAFL